MKKFIILTVFSLAICLIMSYYQNQLNSQTVYSHPLTNTDSIINDSSEIIINNFTFKYIVLSQLKGLQYKNLYLHNEKIIDLQDSLINSQNEFIDSLITKINSTPDNNSGINTLLLAVTNIATLLLTIFLLK